MSLINDIVKCFDAVFTKRDLDEHYRMHTDPNLAKTKLPKGMTKEQYAKKAEQVSLKRIDPLTKKSRKVRAAKRQTGEISKTDGEWFVSYKYGMNGQLLTAFPANESYFNNDIKAKGAKEIFFDE